MVRYDRTGTAGALQIVSWVAGPSEVLVTFGRALTTPGVLRALTWGERPEKCWLQRPTFGSCDGSYSRGWKCSLK